MRKNNHAARAERTLAQFFDVICPTSTALLPVHLQRTPSTIKDTRKKHNSQSPYEMFTFRRRFRCCLDSRTPCRIQLYCIYLTIGGLLNEDVRTLHNDQKQKAKKKARRARDFISFWRQHTKLIGYFCLRISHPLMAVFPTVNAHFRFRAEDNSFTSQILI